MAPRIGVVVGGFAMALGSLVISGCGARTDLGVIAGERKHAIVEAVGDEGRRRFKRCSVPRRGPRTVRGRFVGRVRVGRGGRRGP
jgi:hypothetical protein